MRIFIAVISFLLVAMLTTLTALAGDFAQREIHGFSPNGDLFAFEEYGVQDGSGFPYSNIYIIDTTTDQWTANSPYRARLENDNASIYDAREEAKIMAGPVMKSFENRGLIAGSNKPTELSGNPKHMIVNPRLVVPPIDEKLEFRIENILLSSSDLCESFGATAGFKLLKIGTSNGQTTELLHNDASVPDSRGCPLDYSIADIVTYYPEGANPKFAVIILVTSQGFEGPDGRFMAITGEIN